MRTVWNTEKGSYTDLAGFPVFTPWTTFKGNFSDPFQLPNLFEQLALSLPALDVSGQLAEMIELRWQEKTEPLLDAYEQVIQLEGATRIHISSGYQAVSIRSCYQKGAQKYDWNLHVTKVASFPHGFAEPTGLSPAAVRLLEPGMLILAHIPQFAQASVNVFRGAEPIWSQILCPRVQEWATAAEHLVENWLDCAQYLDKLTRSQRLFGNRKMVTSDHVAQRQNTIFQQLVPEWRPIDHTSFSSLFNNYEWNECSDPIMNGRLTSLLDTLLLLRKASYQEREAHPISLDFAKVSQR